MNQTSAPSVESGVSPFVVLANPSPAPLPDHVYPVAYGLPQTIGPGGAPTVYRIVTPSSDSAGQISDCRRDDLVFQSQPLQEGCNGITNELLLQIVWHRLHCFQCGPAACEENIQALGHIEQALAALFARHQRLRGNGQAMIDPVAAAIADPNPINEETPATVDETTSNN